jgi:hypothetical protein
VAAVTSYVSVVAIDVYFVGQSGRGADVPFISAVDPKQACHTNWLMPAFKNPPIK